MAPKIFVCTVHVASEPWWSKVQPRFVRMHMPDPTIVAAVDDELGGSPDFDHIEVLDGGHQVKLDRLGTLVTDELSTDDDDVLIFLDGDAFPIRDVLPLAEKTLPKVPLAAICRAEITEDFPHPSFCMTTVGFWKEIGANWELSAEVESDRINDMGAKLRDTLREKCIEWHPMLRTNAFNPHPLLFGIYGGLVYHHGAGFRRPVTALDRRVWRDRVPDGTWTSPDRYQFFFDVVAAQNGIMSDAMKRLITRGPDFYELLELSSYD